MLSHQGEIESYFAAYVLHHDVPALIETLHEELAKINDTNLDSNPMQVTLKALSKIVEEKGEPGEIGEEEVTAESKNRGESPSKLSFKRQVD